MKDKAKVNEEDQQLMDVLDDLKKGITGERTACCARYTNYQSLSLIGKFLNKVLQGERLITPESFNCKLQLFGILLLFGKLARNIKSEFLPRIITMISETRECLIYHCDDKKANELVSEFTSCLKLLHTELELRDATELANLWPEIQQDDDCDECNVLNTCEDADEANELSRDLALERHTRKINDRGLTVRNKGEEHPLRRLRDDIIRLTREVKEHCPSADTPHDKLNYDLLACTLGTTLDIWYNEYVKTDNGQLEIKAIVSDSTRESYLKDEIIENLKRYISAALTLAKKVNSKAYDHLVACQSYINKHEYGDFSADIDRPKHSAVAKADLQQLMNNLEQARNYLAADCKNNCPLPVKIVGTGGKFKKQVDKIEMLGNATLYYTSSYKEGKPLPKGASENEIRKDMIKQGVDLVLNANLSCTEAARELMKHWEGHKPYVREDSLRTAISREVKKESNSRT